MGKIGFCIEECDRSVNKSAIAELKKFGTPVLSDGLNKFYTLNYRIKPVCDSVKIVGTALTVRMRPGDNLMLHKAIGMAKEGEIIVVDTCGCTSNSVLGDLMATAAFKKGVGGIVVDGGVRDIEELKGKKYPVFAKCITPAVGDKDGPGEINVPISCGGVPILPGDYIVGDANGVVVIPPRYLEQVISGAEVKLAYEKKRMEEIEKGIFMKSDIDVKLRAAGVI